MSSVTPSRSEINAALEAMADYRRAAKEQRETHEEEIDQLNEAHEEELDQIESDYETNLVEQEDGASESIQKVKEVSNEALSRERELTAEELKKLKQQTYNRYGRIQDDEVVPLKDQVKRLSRDIEDIKERNEFANENLKRSHERQIENLHQEQNRELERVTESARESAFSAYRKAHQDENAEYQRANQEAQDRFHILNRERVSELNAIKEAQHLLDESRKDLEYQKSKSDSATDERVDRAIREGQARERKAVEISRKNRAEESSQYRNQIQQLSEMKDDFGKGFSEGRLEAIKQFERDQHLREQGIYANGRREADLLQEQLNEASERYSRKNSENITDLKKRFTHMLLDKTQDQHDREKNLRGMFEKHIDEMEKNSAENKASLEKKHEAQMVVAQENQRKALEKQNQAFQTAFSVQRENLSDEVDLLQRELHKQRTSIDPSEVAPGAEEAIRKLVVQDYEKVLSEEQSRGNRAVEFIRNESKEDLTELTEESNREISNLRRKNAYDGIRSQQKLANYIEESEMNREQSLRAMQDGHQREQDAVTRRHHNSLAGTVRHYEEVIESLRLRNETQMQAMRQEQEFRERMAMRESAVERQKIIREYENKMIHEKQQYEDIISSLKQENSKMISDIRRERQSALDQQARDYEHRIKEINFQNDEKERRLAENYEDQLERIRDTNARLIQKKS